jgi:hypothetical protein
MLYTYTWNIRPFTRAIFCCDFPFLMNVNEWINNECAECVVPHLHICAWFNHSFTSVKRRKSPWNRSGWIARVSEPTIRTNFKVIIARILYCRLCMRTILNFKNLVMRTKEISYNWKPTCTTLMEIMRYISCRCNYASNLRRCKSFPYIGQFFPYRYVFTR